MSVYFCFYFLLVLNLINSVLPFLSIVIINKKCHYFKNFFFDFGRGRISKVWNNCVANQIACLAISGIWVRLLPIAIQLHKWCPYAGKYWRPLVFLLRSEILYMFSTQSPFCNVINAWKQCNGIVPRSFLNHGGFLRFYESIPRTSYHIK